MELGISIVLGLRIFWIALVVLCSIGCLPLGAAREFVLNIGHRGKLKLATTADNLPRFTVPQRWFTHFYLLGLLVNTALLTITFLFAYACTFPIQEHESQVSAIFSALGGAGTRDASGGIGTVEHLAEYRGRAWSSFLLLVMMEAQVLRRIFENFHVFQFSPLARMHVLGYLVGMGYYPAASFTLFTQHFQDRDYMSLISKFLLQRLGGAWILHTGPPLLNSQIKLQDYAKSLQGFEAFQWIGLAVFSLGWIQQYRTHCILASLRSKEVRTGVGAVFKPFAVDRKRANRYEIPRGSWFEWVSCAHYSAEIVRFFFFSVAFSLSLIKGQ
ncbi:hypothetical protein KC19_6G217400 [Ceratodon purpureus]|uniref:3-oxo-5-alpha-steroid 4-dehydrogenase C-terminal domain-containing protein n=1 Tax=Ceratodon purpureus TaxID=3225 RepID=A0A8T0HK75_CERPU|nr:hypothetical protein KC19_6G217400 [Ceratodon purpureus]KAG0571180.1 hypothetical protein KC19_6G217400 [Ceratodon purpureus]